MTNPFITIKPYHPIRKSLIRVRRSIGMIQRVWGWSQRLCVKWNEVHKDFIEEGGTENITGLRKLHGLKIESNLSKPFKTKWSIWGNWSREDKLKDKSSVCELWLYILNVIYDFYFIAHQFIGISALLADTAASSWRPTSSTEARTLVPLSLPRGRLALIRWRCSRSWIIMEACHARLTSETAYRFVPNI